MAIDTNATNQPLDTSFKSKTRWFSLIKDYISVLKLGIVIPNLITAILGMWLASGGLRGFFSGSIFTILLATIGIFLILGSGTSFNNYFDNDIDKKMTRTQQRVLVQGKLQSKHVLWYSLVMLVLGLVILSSIHLLTGLIALAGWIGYSIIYTVWAKRRHWINTIVGSFSGAVPPLIGWSAIHNHLAVGAWILFFIMFFWQPPHFYAIAIKRRDDYKNAGIPMLPVVKTLKETKWQMIAFVLVLIPVSVSLYFFAHLNLVYLIISLILGIAWLRILFKRENNVTKWSESNFKFSLIYLMALYVSIFIGAI